MNTFTLQEEQSEKGYSRNINLSFTNETASTVASVVGGYVPFSAPSNRQQVVTTEQQQQPILPPFQVSEEIVDNDSETQNNTEKKIQNSLDTNSASNYFEKDDDGYLISKFPDYKGKNKKLQQQRFSLIYVWAYELYFNSSLPKEHLNQASKINGIYDHNYTNYLKDTASRFFINNSDTFKLNPTGKNEVDKILSEIKDPELKGAEYWNPRKRNSSPRTNKEEEQRIGQWIKMESSFDNYNFDVRKLKSAADFAILALYQLTKELKVEESVKPALAINYLFKRYTTISKSKRTIKESLAHKNYNKFFCRTDEGKYYLSPEAEKLAESWLTESNTNS
ncbi:MAG: hypothetical protein AAF298_21695 [Cyanobacteria bacterium P01_A01_bin.40]